MENTAGMVIDASQNPQGRHGVIGSSRPNAQAIQSGGQTAAHMQVPTPGTGYRTPLPQAEYEGDPQSYQDEAKIGTLLVVKRAEEEESNEGRIIAATFYESVANAFASDVEGRSILKESVMVVGSNVYLLQSETPIPMSDLKGMDELAARALDKLSDDERAALGLPVRKQEPEGK